MQKLFAQSRESTGQTTSIADELKRSQEAVSSSQTSTKAAVKTIDKQKAKDDPATARQAAKVAKKAASD